MAKGLTYNEFQQMAMDNYNNGGDTYVECWGQQEFDEYTKQFGPMTKTKAKQMFKMNASIEHEYEEAAKWYSGEGYEQETNTTNSKEDKDMANNNAQVQVMDFEFNGVRYTNTRPGYYYKKENGKQVRIGKAEWDTAWEASGEAEKQAREAEQAKKEAKLAKKKARKNKGNETVQDKKIENCAELLNNVYHVHAPAPISKEDRSVNALIKMRKDAARAEKAEKEARAAKRKKK